MKISYLHLHLWLEYVKSRAGGLMVVLPLYVYVVRRATSLMTKHLHFGHSVLFLSNDVDWNPTSLPYLYTREFVKDVPSENLSFLYVYRLLSYSYVSTLTPGLAHIVENGPTLKTEFL